jgi:shikimate kinase
MNIFLLGYRGSGKSTVGRLLADRLWRPFIDTDDMIVRRAGKSIARLFSEDGEAGFRRVESEIIREVVLLEEHVIALGGGAVLSPVNREAIMASQSKRIYLRCDVGVLARRIEGDPGTAANRPALTRHGGGVEEIQSVLDVREPIYRQVMTSELDVTAISAAEACAAIVGAL